MAAHKKRTTTATKRHPAKKRSKPAAASRSGARTRSGAHLEALDADWRSFISKSTDGVALTEVWKEPKGTPSARAVIRNATKKKSGKKTPGKKPKTIAVKAKKK